MQGLVFRCFLKSRAISTELCKNGFLPFPADLGETAWEMCLWAEHPQSSPLLSPPTGQPFCAVLFHPHRTRQVGLISTRTREGRPRAIPRGRKAGERWGGENSHLRPSGPSSPASLLGKRESWCVCREFKSRPFCGHCRSGRRGPRTPDLAPSGQTCSGESRCPGLEMQTRPLEGIPEIMPVPKGSGSARRIPWVKEFQEKQGH